MPRAHKDNFAVHSPNPNPTLTLTPTRLDRGACRARRAGRRAGAVRRPGGQPRAVHRLQRGLYYSGPILLSTQIPYSNSHDSNAPPVNTDLASLIHTPHIHPEACLQEASVAELLVATLLNAFRFG
eukprot:scaffold6818_cov60-Phaeocystis_antarctica.AAC.2